MAMVRQLKTVGFRPKSRYDIFVDQLSVLGSLTGALVSLSLLSNLTDSLLLPLRTHVNTLKNKPNIKYEATTMNLKYCNSAKRVTQNMLATYSLPIIGIVHGCLLNETFALILF